MSDNIELNPGSGGPFAATDNVGGSHFQRVKIDLGADGLSAPVAGTMPVSGTLTVDNFPAQTGLTDAELRAAAVPVADDAIARLLSLLLNYQDSPRGYDKSLQRQRGTVLVESGTVTAVTTVTTVATVTNVTSLNNIDGYGGRMQVLGQNQTAWQACVRARIS